MSNVSAKSVTEAVRIATGDEGPTLVQIAARSYEVRTYDPIFEAWTPSVGMDYHRARAYLTEARHAAALVAMGWGVYDAQYEALDFKAVGPLRDRVSRSAAKRAAKGGAA